MQRCIEDLVPPLALRNRSDPWWTNVKASDEFLDRIFDEYFRRLNLPNLMRKSDYHELARLVPKDLIAAEIVEKLDAIAEVARSAKPLTEPE
ncbi:MAG: hypothetical protein AAB225_27040 [Acidobacteriota bacterium]